MKNESLDGLRGVAALCVVMSHMLLSFFPYLGINLARAGEIPAAYPWERYAILPIFEVFFNGSFAVSIFFVLSGYVLTIKFFETGDRHALYGGAIKRYPRLIIPAAASVFFAWVLLYTGHMNTFRIPELGGAGWPYTDYNHGVSLKEAMWDAWIAAPFMAKNDMNAPLWTISIELLGSLALFASYAISGPRRALLSAALFLALTLALSSGGILVVHYLSIFAGSFLNRVAPLLKQNPKTCLLLIVAGLVGGATDYSFYYAWIPSMAGNERVVLNAIGAIFLVAGVIGQAHAGIGNALSMSLPQRLGKMSFSIYLLHWPIICSFGFGASYYLQFTVGYSQQIASFIVMPATLVVGYGSAFFFERFVETPAAATANRLSAFILKST